MDWGKKYNDGQGNYYYFPYGDISFADSVVEYVKGEPGPIWAFSRPQFILGPPDYDAYRDAGYVSLGCGGMIIIKFTDNFLVDVEGPDLFIFELGSPESMNLSISKNGKDWIEIGRIPGGKTSVDISRWVTKDEAFQYVRLIDLKDECNSYYPGADIDAIGAVGSAIRILFRSEALFEFNKWDITEHAKLKLDEAFEKINQFKNVKILIEGHTDSIGTYINNLTLSDSRAKSVGAYFISKGLPEGSEIEMQGFGEIYPVADNGLPEGREKNRRVEVILIPK